MNIHSRFAAHVLSLGLLLSGCAAEQESLHEHDHHEPAHWPRDMLQAAELIQERLAALQAEAAMGQKQRQQLIKELQDLVEWAPEIAADTGVNEADWLPIYELSEIMRLHLRDPQVDPIDLAGDFEKLQTLLRQHAPDVADSLPAPETQDALLPSSISQESSR